MFNLRLSGKRREKKIKKKSIMKEEQKENKNKFKDVKINHFALSKIWKVAVSTMIFKICYSMGPRPVWARFHSPHQDQANTS